MSPTEVGHSYDLIANRWLTPEQPLSGLPQHARALQFVIARGHALDVGCGCNGRLNEFLGEQGFTVEGVDVSERMIALAKQQQPFMHFYQVDVCQWELPRKYDFITGWDSIWHVPLAEQGGVLRKLCEGLNGGGVLIFTTGGVDRPGEVEDAYMGPPMYTAALGIPQTLALLTEHGCVCRHLEYDQLPQPHVYIIAQKS